MFQSAAKSQIKKSQSAANAGFQNKPKNPSTTGMNDNRPETIAQRKLKSGTSNDTSALQLKGYNNRQNNAISTTDTASKGRQDVKSGNINIRNSGGPGIQRKEAPVQFGGWWDNDIIATEEQYNDLFYECYFKYYVNEIGTSEDLKRVLGGKTRKAIDFFTKTTDNRDLRNHLKESIGIKYRKAVDQNSILAEDNPHNRNIRQKTHESIKEDKKRVLDNTIDDVLYSFSIMADDQFDVSDLEKKRTSYLKGESKSKSDLEDWFKSEFKSYAEDWIDSAVKKIKNGQHPIYDTNIYDFMDDQISEIDFEEQSSALIRDKIQEQTVGATMHTIGNKIDAALKEHDVVKLSLNATLPVLNAGLLASASVKFDFQGTAMNKSFKKLNANAKLSIGASAKVLKIFNFAAGMGGYFEAEGGNTEELMRLFSYGAYKVVGNVSKYLANSLWNTENQETAEVWAAKREQDSLINDNYVEAAAFLNAEAGFDAGLYAKNLGTERGKGIRYSKNFPGGTVFNYTQTNNRKSTFKAMESYDFNKKKQNYLNNEDLNETSYRFSGKVTDGIIGKMKYITRKGDAKHYNLQIPDWINKIVDAQNIDNGDKEFIKKASAELAGRVNKDLDMHENFILEFSVNIGTQKRSAELQAKKDGNAIDISHVKKSSSRDEERSISKTLVGDKNRFNLNGYNAGIKYSTQNLITTAHTEDDILSEGYGANKVYTSKREQSPFKKFKLLKP